MRQYSLHAGGRYLGYQQPRLKDGPAATPARVLVQEDGVGPWARGKHVEVPITVHLQPQNHTRAQGITSMLGPSRQAPTVARRRAYSLPPPSLPMGHDP
jgi:hypothetical protein